MNSFLMAFGIFLSSISNTACLIPDDYRLTITVKSNDTYAVVYKGDVLFAPAVDAMVRGEYDEYKDEQVSQIIQEFQNTEGMKSVDYLGEGRFNIDYRVVNDFGDDFYFISEDLSFFKISSTFDELRIEGIELSSEVKSELKSVDINMKGNFKVKCQNGIKVRHHNSKSKEKKNNSTNYNWKLDLDTPIPNIKIELNNSNGNSNDFVESDNSVQIEGYQINYIGNKDNGDGTSTWNYTIKVSDEATPGLDHWVLALDKDHYVLNACEDYSGWPGIDKNSNIYGISFYEWYDEGDVLKPYYFTLEGNYEVGLLPVSLTAGGKHGKTVINGPTGKAPGNNNDDAYADNENSVLIDGFRFIYQGHQNNPDGTSTWNYSVRSTNASAHHFSGFVLNLGPRLKVNSGGVGYRGMYTDQHIGLYGAVFYETINKNDDYEDFYFVLNEQYEPGEVEFSYINAGDEVKEGKIKGPSEIPLEPEEWNSNYKTYFVGDFVIYEKSGYICIKSHTTSPTGKVEPNISEDLWEIVYGEGNGADDVIEIGGDTEIDGYVFDYLRYENNSDGSSTWYYKVSSIGSAKNDLTEWVLGLDQQHEVINGEGFEKVEDHKHSGVYGAVFNEKVKKKDDFEEYSLTLKYQYEPGEVEVGIRAGSYRGTGFLTGPSDKRIDIAVNDEHGTDLLSMVTFFDKIITEFYNENGYYGRTWGHYAYTDLGLDPEDYNNVYYDKFEFAPKGSKLNLSLEDGYTIDVKTISGEDVSFNSNYNWNLIYDTVTNYWYYYSVDPSRLININSLRITETD